MVAVGAAAALLSAGAMAATLTGDTASAETLSLAVDAPTARWSPEQSRSQREEAAQLVAERRTSMAQRAVAAARSAQREKVKAAQLAKARKAKAAALAKARKAEADRAARSAARKRLVSDAQDNPKAVARMLLPEYGFGQGQFSCLERLWIGESNWRYTAENSSSGAYGIPQALPGRKMASVADDWRTNPVTQIRWGLNYIKLSYGSPCNALDQWNSRSPHWY